MNLIINADDFGISKGVNYGIYDAHIYGVVTSTSLMVTMPEVKHALGLAKKIPSLKIGLHLNITFGQPITNCKSLLKPNGNFYKPLENPNQDKFDEEEIYQEFLAQYNLFVKVMGKKPTHLDSHLYAHQKYEKGKRAVIRLAIEMDIPVRALDIEGYKTSKFLDFFKYKKGDDLIAIFEENIPNIKNHEICELMVHPGYVDDFLLEFSTYNLPRVEEIEILTSDKLKTLLQENNINLVNFEFLRR
ncbi:carbohydrate deacetylase [Mycoplasmatota bacterium WC30]